MPCLNNIALLQFVTNLQYFSNIMYASNLLTITVKAALESSVLPL